MKFKVILFGIDTKPYIDDSVESIVGKSIKSSQQNSFNSPLSDSELQSNEVKKSRLRDLLETGGGGQPSQKKQGQNNFEESPYYKQAARYAEGDYDQEDFTPGYRDSIHVADASGKVIGTYPIFASAVVAPSTIFTKKKKAIADYILALEQSKTQAKPDSLATDFAVGDPSLQGAISGVQMEGYNGVGNQAQKTGTRLDGGWTPGHPAYGSLTMIQQKGIEQGNLTKGIGAQVEALEKEGVSVNSTFSNKANQAMQDWKALQTLSREEQLQLFRYNEKGEDAATPILQDIQRQLQAYSSIMPLANGGVKAITDSANSYIDKNTGASYDEYIISTIKSKYPLEELDVDEKGNVILTEANKDKFLTSVATSLAISKPELFQDAQFGTKKAKQTRFGTPTGVNDDGSDPNAPYTLDELKDHLRNNLGFQSLKSIHTQMKPSKGAGTAEYAQTTAVPKFITTAATDLKRGKAVSGKDGNNRLISGTKAFTVITDGVITDITPISNADEAVRRMIEVGAQDSKTYGNIDVASATANTETNKDIYSRFVAQYPDRTLRPKLEPATSNFQTRFNNNLYQFAGANGAPLAKGVNIYSVNSLSKNKSDSEFYFNGQKDGGDRGNGVILPETILNGYQTEEGKGWQYLFVPGVRALDNPVPVKIPVGSIGEFIGDTYYKKSEDGKYYTVMKKTKENQESPFHFVNSKGKEIKQDVTVPAYFVNNIVNKPEELIKKFDAMYPESEDNDGVERIAVKTPNVATKTAGKSSVATAETKKAAVSVNEDDEIINSTLNFENKKGYSNYGFTSYSGKLNQQQALDKAKSEYLPLVKDLPAPLRAVAFDFAFNSEDPRASLMVANENITIEDKKSLYRGGKLDKSKVDYLWNTYEDSVISFYEADPKKFLDKFDKERARSYTSTNGADKKLSEWKERVVESRKIADKLLANSKSNVPTSNQTYSDSVAIAAKHFVNNKGTVGGKELNLEEAKELMLKKSKSQIVYFESMYEDAIRNGVTK